MKARLSLFAQSMTQEGLQQRRKLLNDTTAELNAAIALRAQRPDRDTLIRAQMANLSQNDHNIATPLVDIMLSYDRLDGLIPHLQAMQKTHIDFFNKIEKYFNKKIIDEPDSYIFANKQRKMI